MEKIVKIAFEAIVAGLLLWFFIEKFWSLLAFLSLY